MIPEEMLCAAAARSYEAYVSYLEAGYDDGEKHEFSKAFEKRIDRLKRRADHPVFYQTVRRVAIILIAILFAGTIWIAVDSDARAAFYGWITETVDTYFVYHYEGEAHSDTEPSDYRPGWLPSGYSESSVSETSARTRIVYTNADNSIIRFVYMRNTDEPYLFIDSEDVAIQEIRINSRPGELFLANDSAVANAISWVGSDNIVFFISGFVAGEELLRIAESVRAVS